MTPLSPIARMQRASYPSEHPLAVATAVRNRAAARGTPLGRLGFFGAAAVTGAAKGASAGAAVGSVVPVIGTAIGAIAGAIGGAISSTIDKVDPENKNFSQAQAMGNANPSAVLTIGNKYLVLAGLFDLTPSQVGHNFSPYTRYGRMGEQKFVTDMMTLVYNAAQSGQITASDTPQSIFLNVINPWIQTMGPWTAANANQPWLAYLLIGMIAEYVAGLQSRWLPVGGQQNLWNALPAFSLPGAAASPTSAAPATQYAPIPAVATSPVAAVTAPASTPAVSVPAGYTLIGNANGLPVYQGPSNTFYTLSGSTLTPFTGTLPAPAGGAAVNIVNGMAQPATPTTVSVPAGFTLIGMANGLAAYQGLDGNYYSWNGSTMSLLTGVLTASNGMSAQITNGQPQQSMASPSLGTASQQLYNTATAPAGGTTVSTYPASTGGVSPQYAPTTPVTAAGNTGEGLPSWLTWGAVAAAAYFMLSTARPVGGRPKKKRAAVSEED